MQALNRDDSEMRNVVSRNAPKFRPCSFPGACRRLLEPVSRSPSLLPTRIRGAGTAGGAAPTRKETD